MTTPCFQHDSYRRECADCRDMNGDGPAMTTDDKAVERRSLKREAPATRSGVARRVKARSPMAMRPNPSWREMMDELREKVARAIAEAEWNATNLDDEKNAKIAYDLTNNSGRFVYDEMATAALALPEIAEGQELRRLKLEDDAENQRLGAGQ